MHPENVRHLIGDGRSFKLCPVLAPARNLNLDLHVRMCLRIGVAHGLHAVPLGHIPDLECEMGFPVRRACPAAPKCQSRSAYCRQYGRFFQFLHTFPSFL